MTRSIRSLFGWSLTALGLLASSAPTPAQTFWVPTTGGNWFTPANWDAGLPNSTSAWARFGWSGAGNQTVTVDGTATVGRMTFGFLSNESSTSSFVYTLSGGGITLNNGGSAALIERSRTDGESTVETPLTIAGNGALILNNGGFTNGPALGTLTIASLAGANSTVTINGTGVGSDPGVVVIQSGSYGGITDIRGGVLRANEGTGLPATTSLRLNGGVWEVTQTTTVTRSLGTSAGTIQLGSGTAGFSTTAANSTLTLRLGVNGGVGTIQWGSASFNPSVLAFGRGASPSGSETYVLENGLDLNGATRTVETGSRAFAFVSNVVNTSGTAAGLTYRGSPDGRGTLVLHGTGTYNGPTTVTRGGVLRTRHGAGLPAASNLVLNDGTLEYLDAGSFDRAPGTGAGQVRVLGTSGFAAWGGPFNVQLDGPGTTTGTVVWGSADFNPGVLQFGSPNANSTVDFQTGINLNGSVRFVTYWDRSPSTTDLARISGVISNSTGTGVLVVGGNGTVELSGANTYNGETFVFAAPGMTLPGTVLRLVGSGSFANSPRVTVGAGRFLDVTGLTGGANFDAASGRFRVTPNRTLRGTGTVTGAVLVGVGGRIRGGARDTGSSELDLPTGQLTVNGPLRLQGSGPSAAPARLEVDLNGTSASGATVSRVAVTGAGNAWDFDTVTAGGPVELRLLNDQNLTANQSYSYVIGSSAGGFTRNGSSVTAFAYGTDFDLASSIFPTFTGVTLTVDGSNNLILNFTPVPEPAAVLAVAAVGLGLRRLRRRLS